MLKSYLTLFRLPNLPTAPGDAWAGAALACVLLGTQIAPTVPQLLAVGFAALFLYLFGLVDNDLVDVMRDHIISPMRPLVTGEISRRTAQMLRSLTLLVAGSFGFFFHFSLLWFGFFVLLSFTILLYNRSKSKLCMGLCRGLSLMLGSFAFVPDGRALSILGPVLLVALGWILYIVAVTRLSEGEENSSQGLSPCCFLWGLSAFVPLSAIIFLSPFQMLAPLAGSLATYALWCVRVSPLRRAHTSHERKQAVGATIQALTYLQTGWMLLEPSTLWLCAACALFFSARLIRHVAPTIHGS